MGFGFGEAAGAVGGFAGELAAGLGGAIDVDVNEAAFGGQEFDALQAQLAQGPSGPSDLQQQAGGLLVGQATGQAPSAAAIGATNRLGDVAATQRSQAASAQGVNPALRQALAAQNIGQSQQTASGQAAQLQAQEQAQAQAQLAQFSQTQDAQQQQATQFFMSQGFDIASANQQAQIALAQTQAQLESQAQGAGLAALGGIAGAVVG